MIRRSTRQSAAALLLLASVAACSHEQRPQASAVPPIAVAPGQIDGIQNALLAGERKTAERQLKGLLRAAPMNPSLQLLANSIDKDPQDLLGPKNYAYTVRPGETITDIAQRLLGNRLKAYQLARYNALATPVTLIAGQTLRIPGEVAAPRPAQVAQPLPAPDKPHHPSAAIVAKPAARPSGAVANPVEAQRLRAQGLAVLNRGNVGEAVGLLRRAQALDPANALIARDLGRAERIQATVRSKK